MTTLGEIRTNVAKNLKDTSISSTQIIAAINEGARHVAKKILLPDLESSGVVDTVTDNYYVIVPAAWNFMRNFYSCEIADVESPTILNSVEHLRRIIPEFETEQESGDIQYIVPTMATLMYYPIPETVTTLNCRFYKLPATLAKDSDVVEGIPSGYEELLLENYALGKLWKIIEDEMEGPSRNTQFHKSTFTYYFEELDEQIDSGQSRAEVARINHFSI